MGTLRELVDDIQNVETNLTLDIKLKKCKTCHKLLPLSEYHKDPKSKDRLFYSCKACYNIYRKNVRKNNPKSEEEKKEYNRKNRIYYANNRERKAYTSKKRKEEYPRDYRNRAYKLKYGIDIDTYDEMLKKQNESCAICKIHQSQLNYLLVVDHCHTTNKIRGLLCRKCNVAIGSFKDNIEVIMSAIYYLEKSKENEHS